jgi:hypothetical protein
MTNCGNDWQFLTDEGDEYCHDRVDMVYFAVTTTMAKTTVDDRKMGMSTDPYQFHGPPSEACLRAYLARAVTYARGFASHTLPDDLRMIAKVGARFLGRSALIWSPDPDDNEHFRKAAAFAAQVHAVDPGIICQAAVFEAVYPEVDAIGIPEWVFTALGEPVERRRFRYSEMVRPGAGDGEHWRQFGEGCRVPDLTQAETRRWFYYRCRCYIEAGFEAIHLGQPHLYAATDDGYALLDQLIRHVRDYAAVAARRGWVFLDAHTHGIVRGGRLLFDFHSRPISATNDLAHPEGIILQHRGTSRGGIAPAGWTTASLPFLLEVDNWGGWSMPAEKRNDLVARSQAMRWGWDDIAWFAHQPATVRQHFLKYAHRWLRSADSAGYFQIPIRRLLGEAPVSDSTGAPVWHYQANRPSLACPQGFGDEDAIAALWSEPESAWLADYHAANLRWHRAHPTLANGIDAPELVYLVGPIQTALGGIAGDAMSHYSRLFSHGDGTFERAVVIPHGGEYPFTVSIDGTMTEYYRRGGLPTNPVWRLVTTEANQTVLLRFDYRTRQVQALDQAGRSLLVT